jgi:polysaccharide pyruvyl transferase WcaK-like protein
MLAALRARDIQFRVRCPDPASFIEQIARLELLVSGRFHACTLSLGARTPFVAVPSNTGKILALVEDVGLQRWRADVRLHAPDINDARLLGWQAGELAAVSDYLAHARSSAESLFADIRALT